jgi:hypothetical protein
LPNGRSSIGNTPYKEKGVSVYGAWHDVKNDIYVILSGETDLSSLYEMLDRPAFLVSGDRLDYNGEDNEPLLKVGTIKIIKEIPHSKIVTDNSIGSDGETESIDGSEVFVDIDSIVTKSEVEKYRLLKLMKRIWYGSWCYKRDHEGFKKHAIRSGIPEIMIDDFLKDFNPKLNIKD